MSKAKTMLGDINVEGWPIFNEKEDLYWEREWKY